MLGIIGAMADEVAQLKKEMNNVKIVHKRGIPRGIFKMDELLAVLLHD